MKALHFISSKYTRILFSILLLNFFFISSSNATDYYFTADGNWSDLTKWKTGSCGGSAAATLPTSSDNVYLCNDVDLTVDIVGATCLNLYGNINNSPTLIISSGNSLTISGNLEYNSGTDGNGISVSGTGTTLTVIGNVNFGKNNGKIFTIDATCTVTVGGYFTIAAKDSKVRVNGILSVTGTVTDSHNNSNGFEGSGTVKIGGNFIFNGGGSWNGSSLIFEMNGCGQTININKSITIAKLIQSNTCGTLYTVTNTGNTLTTTTYDQNCNSVNLRSVSGNGGAGTGFSNTAAINNTCPAITLSATSKTNLNYCLGAGPSAEQTYTVSGSNLTDNITITAPTNYEMSLSSGGGYTSPITLNHTAGTINVTTIYIRLAGGLAAADYNLQNISHTSTGATTKNVSCSGTVIASGPNISSHPSTSSSTYCLNQVPTDLSVTASGIGLTYQWYYNTSASNSGGTLIGGATTSTYTPPTNVANTRYYYVEVSGTCSPAATSNVSGAITTNALVVAPNAITSNSPTCVGTGITFTQGACNEGTCYWVSSATGTETTNSSATYTTATTAGTYTVWVRAKNGNCWSNAVTLSGTVNAAPTITSQPTTATTNGCIGASPTALSVTATGAGLTYQWYSNISASNSGGTIIPLATSASFTPPTTVAGTKYYYCIVSGTCAPSVTSNVSGPVIVRTNPTISASVNATDISTNSTILFTATPDGLPTYSWTGPNSFTSSLQNPTFANPTTAASGTYTVTGTDIYGCTATSTTSAITVSAATNYYYDGSGDMSVLTNWGTNVNGTGSNPPNFSTNYQTFNIIHNATSTPSMGTSNWTVSGNGSKIIVGNGTNATNFTIPASYSLNLASPAVIDVKAAATLTITNNNTSTFILGSLAQTSTVVYNGDGAQTIQANNYGNLTVSGARISSPEITFAAGTITAYNTVTLSASGCTWGTTGNTFVYDGIGAQTIASPAGFSYYNLHTEYGGTKTLGANTTIVNKLRIGAITTLALSSYTLNLDGQDTIVSFIGNFSCGTSTVNYRNANNAVVEALDYYNLNLSGGNRTLSKKNIIGISNVFTPGAGVMTVDQSTVKFFGTIAQICPSFTFYNLLIDKNHASNGLTLNGDITVQGFLTFKYGKLYTTSYTVNVTNTMPHAVSPGTASSYIDGKLKRSIPANLSSHANIYVFPLGDYTGTDNYLPFSLNNITSGSTAPTVTIQAFKANCGGTAGTGLTSISTTEYWEGTTTGSYTSARVSLTKNDGLGSLNAVSRSATINGVYDTKKGTVSGNSVINSDLTGFSFYALAVSSTVSETYYYSGTGDITSTSNWFTGSGGTGTSLASHADATKQNFLVDNRTYIFNSTTATLTSDWYVTGANTVIQVGVNDKATQSELIIAGGTTLYTTNVLRVHEMGELNVNSGGIVTVGGDFDLAVTHKGSQQTESVTNSGTINIYGNLYQRGYSYSTITNNATGIINLNGNFTKEEKTWFYNSGDINITNGSFILSGNQDSFFENRSGSNVTVDNSNTPYKTVEFGRTSDNIDLNEGMQIFAGSSFHVLNSNLSFAGQNTLAIGGELVVQNGNVDMNIGGGAVTIASTGGLYVSDTDNNGDGLLNLNYGALAFTNNGVVYAEGIMPSSGANAVTVTSGAEMFIGNIGLYTGTNNNQLVVNGGGTLNYCGNKTALADNVGTIQTGGLLNYAGGYYTTQTPKAQNDFAVSAGGMEVEAFEDAEVCRFAFLTGSPQNIGFLPINLSMIYGVCENNNKIINWQTLSEFNNSYFTVYRSTNGLNFEPIATIKGAGNSNTLRNYKYIDNTKLSGIVYYTIEQTDFDGTSTASKIIVVRDCSAINSKVTFNIFENNATIALPEGLAGVITITSIDGKQLYSKQFEGFNFFNISLPIEAGTYILSVQTAMFIESVKIVKP